MNCTTVSAKTTQVTMAAARVGAARTSACLVRFPFQVADSRALLAPLARSGPDMWHRASVDPGDRAVGGPSALARRRGGPALQISLALLILGVRSAWLPPGAADSRSRAAFVHYMYSPRGNGRRLGGIRLWPGSRVSPPTHPRIHAPTHALRTSVRRHTRLQNRAAFFGNAKTLAPASKAAMAAKRQAVRGAVKVNAKIGDTLEEFLMEATGDAKLRQVMMSMSEAIRTIAFKVRTASCGATACINSFGDEQLAVDLLADKLLFEALRYSGCCKLACSEEVPEPLDLGGSGFSVAFDPLDGSSIVDTNFSVGTIFGVWPGDELTGITGRDQAAAGMGIYGPRTVFCLALKDAPGCHVFLLQDAGKGLHVKETVGIDLAGRARVLIPTDVRPLIAPPPLLTPSLALRASLAADPHRGRQDVRVYPALTHSPTPSHVRSLTRSHIRSLARSLALAGSPRVT